MRIVESFTAGKTGDDRLNEDAIIVCDDYAGIFDGVTSRSGETLQGLTTGRFAAQTLVAVMRRLPPQLSAIDAVTVLTQELKRATEQAAKAEGKSWDTLQSRPAAAMVIYSRARGEIWRLADPPFMVDGVENSFMLMQEKHWSAIRHYYITAMLVKGMTEDDLLDHDPFMAYLKQLVAETGVFANHDSAPYGYGVLNGRAVPDRHVGVTSVKGAAEIVLASDGYPKIFQTLQETEAYLSRVLAKDPLMYRLHPQVKGMKKGNVSFDDRSYLRIRL